MNKSETLMLSSVFLLLALFMAGTYLGLYCVISKTTELVYGRDFDTWTLGYKTITYLHFNYPYMNLGILLIFSEIPIVVLQVTATVKRRISKR